MDISIEVLNSNGYVFTDAKKYDAIIFTSSETQRIMLGTQSNAGAALVIDSNEIKYQRTINYGCNIIYNWAIGVMTSNPKASIHTVNDVFIQCNDSPWKTDHGLGLYMRYSTNNGQNGSYIQSVDRTNGSLQSQQLYLEGCNVRLVTGTTSNTQQTRLIVTENGKIGINTSSPTEILDVTGNILTRSNIALYSNQAVIYGSNIGIGLAGRIGYSLFSSNTLDIVGGATVSQSGRYITFHINSNQGGGTPGKAMFNGGTVVLNNSTLSIGASNTQGDLHIARQNTTSNNIIIEASNGYSAINWNGYYNGRIDTNKKRWRLYSDQRTSADFLNIDSYDGTTTYKYLSLCNNNIGINKTSPIGRLHILGSTISGGTDGIQSSNHPLTLEDISGNAMRILHINTNATDSTIYNYEQTKNVYWGETTDTGAYFFRGKNISIGSSNPDVKFMIGEGSSDNSALKFNTGDSDKIYLTNSNNGSKISHCNWAVIIHAGQNNTNTGTILFQTGSNIGYVERLRIDNTGNIGINNKTPTASLHIMGNLTMDDSSNINSSLNIQGKSNQDVGLRIISDSLNQWNIIRKADSSNLQFKHGNGLVPMELSPNAMILNNNLGIGVTDPEAELHIRKTLQIGSSNTIMASESFLTLKGNNTYDSSIWNLYTGAATNSTSTYNTSRLRINNNNTERLTIDSQGYVGIGTSNPTKLLDVNGPIKLVNNMQIMDDSQRRLNIGTVLAAGQFSTSSRSNDVVMRVESDGNFLLQCGTGTAPFCISKTNKIGINTVDPSNILEIIGDTQISANTIPLTLKTLSTTPGLLITPLPYSTQIQSLDAAVRCSFTSNINWNAFSVDFNNVQTSKIDQSGNAMFLGKLNASSIQLSNIPSQRSIVLWDNITNFYGFGVSNNVLRYNAPTKHVFYGDNTKELMTLYSNGTIYMGETLDGYRSLHLLSGYNNDGSGQYYNIGYIRQDTSNIGSVTLEFTFGCSTANSTNSCSCIIQLCTKDGLNSCCYSIGNIPVNMDVQLYGNSNIYVKSYDYFSVALNVRANTCFISNSNWESTRTSTVPSGTLTRSLLKTNYSVLSYGGNLGIGISPTERLHVNCNIKCTSNIEATYGIYSSNWFRSRGNTGWYSEDYGGGVYMTDTTWLKVYNDKNFYTGGSICSVGNMGVGTNAPSYKLHVTGQIYSTDNIIAFSDARYKTNITKIENALEKIKTINGYTFTMNNKQYAGLLAQEVEQILPEVVEQDSEGRKSIAYGNTVALLVQCIKELCDIIKVK